MQQLWLLQEMDEGDVLVAAAGTIPADLTKLFEVNGGKELHLEFGNSCMGYDIPAGIGVRLAGAEKEVYILMGDGNYQMHPMELVTAMQERTKITILLNVNYGYQSIWVNRYNNIFDNLDYKPNLEIKDLSELINLV